MKHACLKYWGLFLLLGFWLPVQAQSPYASLGIIGSATPQGWDASTPMVQDENNPRIWRLDDQELGAGELKFRANDAWDVNWGGSDFPRGTASLNGPNMVINPGTYHIAFNDETGDYSFNDVEVPTYGTVGIIGSASPSGWDASTPLNQDPLNPHLWTLDEITLTEGEIKFRADNDWAVNWGGGTFPSGTTFLNGDNIVAEAGTYSLSYNDETGEFAFDNSAESPVPGFETIGIIGSATPSGWDASTPLQQDANDPNLWTLENLILVDGEAKFRANNAWDVNWGGSDFPNGTATLDGPNIPVTGGTYHVTFHDETGAYTFIDASAPTYETLGIIGSATPLGWDASTPLVQDANNPHLWTLNGLDLSNGEAKFRANDAWDVNWGGSDFPNGTATLDGPNIPVNSGTYDVSFNDITGEYSFSELSGTTYETVGIIGSATPLGWDASSPMQQDVNNPHIWRLIGFTLVDGEAKFRANNAWDVNWGASDFPAGTATQDGPNIPITAGTYTITFNDLSGAYTFEALTGPTYETVGIIGSSTPLGWDASSPMNPDALNPHLWTLTNFILTDGEAKFRANDAWDVNWGAADFPSGLATLDGPNIPVTAGTYDITFNDLSGQYSFVEVLGGDNPIVQLIPELPTPNQEVTLIYDATQGVSGLIGAEKVYLHSGVVISGPDGQVWTHVVGNYGQDDGIGEMSKVPGEDNKWQITLSPSIREYYTVPNDQVIFRLAMVFRNADGSQEGKNNSNGDIYIDIDPGTFVQFTAPIGNEIFAVNGSDVTLSAISSNPADVITMYVDDQEVASEENATEISYTFPATTAETFNVRVEAQVGSQTVSSSKDITLNLRAANQVAALPEGLQSGINYDPNDASKATLVLTAPGKEFVFLVGDFNNWTIDPAYQMNQTPDGEKFWLELTGLTPGQEYIYQYWVDGVIKVGDPFADKVIDPVYDAEITEDIYPNLIQHPQPQHGISTVFQTDQASYQWTYPEPVGGHPRKEDLMIYELLVRDFVGSHSYKDVIDSLDYLQNLGVNALELMPINEFELNESWGYNPSFYFAPDKYYGTKDDLKALIEACHERGMVVLLDIVWNHNYGQSPLVQMYFDNTLGRPTPDSPWFNEESPNQVFSFGFDFNHDSPYTRDLMDRGNRYWLEEYKFDGYRFDFTKGMTNTPGDGGAFDQARIDILKRMADVVWQADPHAYVILEHFADNSEEIQLSNHGIMLWGNMSFTYGDAVEGNVGANFSDALSSSRGWNDKNLVSYMESHDEQRMVWHGITEGLSVGEYNVRDTSIAIERTKLAAAFMYTLPGAKLMWMFGELGYDVDINFNGRVGNKPLPWGEGGLGYYEDPERQKLLKVIAAINKLVNENPDVFEDGGFDWTPSGQLRQINFTSGGMNVTVLGNFGLSSGSFSPGFIHTGTWYDYFGGGAPLEVNSLEQSVDLVPGEFHIYTDQPVDYPEVGLVNFFETALNVEPGQFTADDRVKITFNAGAAGTAGTQGLVGAEKVYLYAGVVKDSPSGTTWENIAGSPNQDNGIGEMSRVPGENNKWTISLRPREYFNLGEEETIYRIGMYFRDAKGQNLGKSSTDEDFYLLVSQGQTAVSVTPASFDADTEVRIEFDANQADPAGTVGLIGASKVYMHSGVVLNDTDSPGGGDWRNVVGNWGQDDGVGQMTPVEGEANTWEITLTPRQYYSMAEGDELFYLSMVFRNENGQAEGKGPGGSDIFIRAQEDSPLAPTGMGAAFNPQGDIEVFWLDTYEGELGYILERSLNGGDFKVIATLCENENFFTDKLSVIAGTITYRVKTITAFNGDSPYSPEASLSQTGVIGFRLIDAGSELVLAEIQDGETVPVFDLANRQLAIEAVNNPAAVGSMHMLMHGPQVSIDRTDNESPYAYFGNIGPNFLGRTLEAGTYSVEATPYTMRNRRGDAGNTQSISFTLEEALVPDLDVQDVLIYNADSDELLQTLQEGDTLQVDPNNPFAIGIVALADKVSVGSVDMDLQSDISFQRLESFAPFSLFGDNGIKDILGITLANGSYTLTVTPYAEKNGGGEAGVPRIFHFVVEGGAVNPNLDVMSFSLFNADTDQAIAGFDPMRDGDEINVNTYRSRLNLVANTDPMQVGSVNLSLSGPINATKIENEAPYALFGDIAGDFFGRGLPVGSYTLKATAYTEPSGQGEISATSQISFSVVDQEALQIGPNPTTGTLQVIIQEEGVLKLLNPQGRVIWEAPVKLGESQYLDLKSQENGLYMLQLETSEKIHRFRVSKQ